MTHFQLLKRMPFNLAIVLKQRLITLIAKTEKVKPVHQIGASGDSVSATNSGRGLPTTSTSETEREPELLPKTRSSEAARSGFLGMIRTGLSGS